MPKIQIRSEKLDRLEISWFAPICDGDDQYLGARDPRFKSSWANTSAIARRADQLGFNNMLCPSSYQVGQDTLTFAAGLALQLQQMSLLAAIRCGEIHPPMLARTLATLDHMLEGRLTINIISSNLPGLDEPSDARYRRSREVIEILKQAWTKDEINFKGEYYNLHLGTAPVVPYQQNGGPLLYFGGYSPAGLDLCAEHCDVYLMWPDTEEKIKAHMLEMSKRAATYGRTVDFGLRVHVIVRESQSEAHQAAEMLMSKLDAAKGVDIKNRAQDAKSLGVALQNELRDTADSDGYAEPHLWTRIGEARSGCGAAIVGDPDQVLAKIRRYQKMGIRSFIFSGYPHLDACDWFGKLVLPHLNVTKLAVEQGRIPTQVPNTPLGAGNRF